MSQAFDDVRIGIVSVSDRASTGVYEDKGLPALKDWLTRALKNPITFEARVRIETPKERDYFQHGGILPFVLRQLMAEEG